MNSARVWLVFLLTALRAIAAPAPLTVDAAAQLAMRHSKGAQLAHNRVAEARIDSEAARQLRFPRLTALGLGGYYFKPLDLKIREGSLTPALDTVGVDLGLGPLSPLIGPFPATDLTLVRGDHTQLFGGLTILQPLSQQWRIASGIKAAQLGRTAAEYEAARTLAQIRMGVEELFAGILLEEKRQAQHVARIAAEERLLRDAETANTVGETLDAAVLGRRASLVQAKADLVRSHQQRARLILQLADLIGLPGTTDLTLAPGLPERSPHPLDYWLMKAAQNPDSQIARATAEKARAGVRAARQARIPDISAYASGFAQDGLPLVPAAGGSVGLALTWDVFDSGRRASDIARSLNQQRAAELNRDRIGDDTARLIRTTYQDYAYAGELEELADQAVAYRRRAADLARQSAEHGLELESSFLDCEADRRKAEAELSGAQLQRHLALLKLYFLIGELQ